MCIRDRVGRLWIAPRRAWRGDAAAWTGSFPPARVEGGRLAGGVVVLNEAEQAKACLALLSVAATKEEAGRILGL